MLVYIHVPFCRTRCRYCAFHSIPLGRGVEPAASPLLRDYLDTLLLELAHWGDRLGGTEVQTVFFGGGTPSLLPPRIVGIVLERLARCFPLSPKAEITLEANPDSAGDWKELRTLRRCGFNRLSLGMQSADDEELSEIGRVHTMAQTEAAVEAARKAKFQNLSLDLIYGLPHQTLEGWQKNLSAALDLTPEHLSCYGLKVEEGTPLFARRGTAGLPGDDAQADMYLYTVEFLKAQGYEQYEISNFAKPGCASRHNLKYWTLGEYAGFGPGAHSDFGGVRYAYTKDLEGYIRGVRDHAPMLSESDRIPPLDRDTEWVMLGLRTTAGLDPKAFERRFRRRFTCFLPFLDQCAKAGYAVEEDGRWHLTPRGFLVSNQIIGGMLDALAADKQRQADAAARGDFRVNLD